MANVGYQAKSLIAGVSTRPYALRQDGHATTQSNCLLSPKYGLTKRPGTTYLQTVEANTTSSDVLMFPLHRGDSDKIVIRTSHTSWQVYSKSGIKYPVCHFPSSASVGNTAASEYGDLSPVTTTTTTLGDVTWVCDSTITPTMKTATWEGYTESGIDDPNGAADGTITVTNDDVFTIHLEQIPWTTDVIMNTFVVLTEKLKADDSLDVIRIQKESKYNESTSVLHARRSFPSTQRMAGLMAYRISGGINGIETAPTPRVNGVDTGGETWGINSDGVRICQCTSLDTQSWGAPNQPLHLDGVDTMIGRFVDKTRGDLVSVTCHAEDTKIGSTATVVFKHVDSLEALPRNSFEDHTVQVTTSDPREAGGFYMRYVSDDNTSSTFSNNDGGYVSGGSSHTPNGKPQFDVTTKLPRTGHWEEYCGAGVTQSLDSGTMPHLFVERPDGSYAFMEAQGSFVTNSADLNVTFEADDDTFKPTAFDGGFTNTSTISPLVVGETIEFSAGTLPSELSLDTTYYIKTKAYDSGWKYTISLTDGGAAVTFSDATPSDCAVTLTTYAAFDWVKRAAGDDTTNPIPPFIDNKINAIFNFQNRLAFVSENSIHFSGTGDYFNVFRGTVRDVIDSDPFTLTPNTEHGDILKFAVAFDRKVIVVSNKAQFAIGAESGFGPTSATVQRISQTASDFYGMPVVVGDHIFLSYSTEDGSGVYDLMQSSTVANKFDAQDLSVNIPGYLPLSPRRMVGSQKHSTLIFLDDGSPDTTEDQNLYVYTWLDTPKGRAHSAWTKWEFGADYEILDTIIVVDRIYILAKTGGMLYLEYIDLDMTTEDSLLSSTLTTNFDRALIDHKTHNTAATTDTDATSGIHGGIYSEAESSDDTTIFLKWKVTSNNKANVVIVKSDGTIYEYDTAGTAADGTITVTPGATATLAFGTTSSSTMTKLVLNGVDITDDNYYVGLKYSMSSAFGPFIPEVQEQSLGGRNIFVRGGRLTYSMANEFKVNIIQDTTYTQTVSATTALDGTKSGDVTFAIRKDMPNLSFEVVNDKPWNAMFQILHYDISVQEVT